MDSGADSTSDPPAMSDTISRRRTANGRKVHKHKCPDCDRYFLCPHNVEQHRREKHTGERPWSCEFCGQHFTRPYTRNRHVFIKHGKKIGPGRGKTSRNYDNPGHPAGETLPASPDTNTVIPGVTLTMPGAVSMSSNMLDISMSTNVQGALSMPSNVIPQPSNSASLPSTAASRPHSQTAESSTKMPTLPGKTTIPKKVRKMIRRFARCRRPSPYVQCLRCNTSFVDEDLLMAHMHDIHAEPASKYCPCKGCREGLRQKSPVPSVSHYHATSQRQTFENSMETVIDPRLHNNHADGAAALDQLLHPAFDSLDLPMAYAHDMYQQQAIGSSTETLIDSIFSNQQADGIGAPVQPLAPDLDLLGVPSMSEPAPGVAPWDCGDAFGTMEDLGLGDSDMVMTDAGFGASDTDQMLNELLPGDGPATPNGWVFGNPPGPTDDFGSSIVGFGELGTAMGGDGFGASETGHTLVELGPRASTSAPKGPYFALDGSLTADQLFMRAPWEDDNDDAGAEGNSDPWEPFFE